MVKPRLNRDLSLIKPIKPLAAAVVPIGGFFKEAGIDTRGPLSQVFSLVAGGRGIQGSSAGTVESHWERLSETGKGVAGGSDWYVS